MKSRFEWDRMMSGRLYSPAKASLDMVLTSPVYFDHGDRVYFGNNFYANTGLTILYENTVTFGDTVFLGPHVSIYTAARPYQG